MLRTQISRRLCLTRVAQADPVRGREDRKLMSPEYISPSQQKPHTLWKRLVRQDCLRRRNQIDLPEFYPGSILAIVYSDKHAPEKKLRFVGRVLNVTGFGTNHKMLLRNIVDDVAVNIKFDLYSPLIQKIDVLKLEKWKDNDLMYMAKFADPEYCRIPFSMMPEIIPPNTEKLKVFDAKIVMKEVDREATPPHTAEEIDNWGQADKGWLPNVKPRRTFRPRQRLMMMRQRPFEQMWPPIHNLLYEDDVIEEDLINAGYHQRRWNWQEFDIMRHHNYDEQHDEIIDQMKKNAKIVPKITRTIGRPKVDYSKISKVWTENYTVENCRTLPPEYTA